MSGPCQPEDDAPLPEVYKARLDGEGLGDLFADLRDLAGPVEVRLKAGPGARAQVAEIPLSRAHGLLRDGLVEGVQVVYEHEGQAWFDTILRRGDGYVVVRMAADR